MCAAHTSLTNLCVTQKLRREVEFPQSRDWNISWGLGLFKTKTFREMEEAGNPLPVAITHELLKKRDYKLFSERWGGGKSSSPFFVGGMDVFLNYAVMINEGVHGKRPQVTSDRHQDSHNKLLLTSSYRRGEYDMRSRVT